MKNFLPSYIANKLPVFGADYAKRILEKIYDKAFDTPEGQRLKNVSDPVKFIIEPAVYAIHTLLDARFGKDSGFGRFLTEVLEDLPSEFCRRMLNGQIDTHQPTQAEKIDIPPLGDFQQIALEKFLAAFTPEEREEFKKEIARKAIELMPALIAQNEISQRKITRVSNERGLVQAIIGNVNQELSQIADNVENWTKNHKEKRRSRGLFGRKKFGIGNQSERRK